MSKGNTHMITEQFLCNLISDLLLYAAPCLSLPRCPLFLLLLFVSFLRPCFSLWCVCVCLSLWTSVSLLLQTERIWEAGGSQDGTEQRTILVPCTLAPPERNPPSFPPSQYSFQDEQDKPLPVPSNQCCKYLLIPPWASTETSSLPHPRGFCVTGHSPPEEQVLGVHSVCSQCSGKKRSGA